jgi:hypothetical protein
MQIIPQRTPLANQELESRSRILSQRHRTVLLMTDGRRNLVQLLDMCQRAGATRAHLDELVRDGFIQLDPRCP